MKARTLSKAEAGRKGGMTTVTRYGTEYMRKIGQRGGHRTHELYEKVPVFQNDFLLVNRHTGEPKALLSGKPLTWTPWNQ